MAAKDFIKFPPTRFWPIKTGRSAVQRKFVVSAAQPYSASKAAADHLVRAYFIPIICDYHFYLLQQLRLASISGKINSAGHHQFITSKKIPLYGAGKNIRDWILSATTIAASSDYQKRQAWRNLLFGGDGEMSNLDLVKNILQ